MLQGVRALPGVESAGVATGVPLTNEHWRTDIYVEGTAVPKPGSFPHPDMHVVSPDYLATIGTRLERGRDFTDADDSKSQRVALINALTAQKLFAQQDPIGKRFTIGRPDKDKTPQWIIIVGLVEDTKMYGLANPARMEFYLPLLQNASNEADLVVKSKIEPASGKH